MQPNCLSRFAMLHGIAGNMCMHCSYKTSWSSWLGITLTVWLWCAPAQATFPGSQNQNSAAQDKAQAARQAQRQFQGRVLKVETLKTTYRVKILQKSGRVISVEVKRAVYVTSPIPNSRNSSSSRATATKPGNRE